MFNQQPFGQGNFGGYPQGGMQYAQMPVAKMTQVLTPEQMKQLRTTSSQFSLQVDPIEITRSLCTHKDNGKIALIDNQDGSVTCTICGAKFKLVDWEVVQVQEVTNMFIDVLQSIKTYYLDIPESYVTEYFKMIPLLEKVPKFFELAYHNFKKYEQGNQFQQNNGMYGFNMLSAIAGPGMMNPGFNQGQQGFGQGGQQGFVQGGPVGAPMYQPAGGYGSPFVSQGYPGQYPQGQEYQQPCQPQQQQPVQQQQPAQSVPTGQQGPTVQTTKMFNL